MESNFSPREIVSELDKFIIGQNNAKKAVAVALRNRWRRKQLPENLKNDVNTKKKTLVGDKSMIFIFIVNEGNETLLEIEIKEEN